MISFGKAFLCLFLFLAPCHARAFDSVEFPSEISEGEDLDILVHGVFADACYFVDSAWTAVAGDVLTLEIHIDHLSGVACATVLVDYEVPAVFNGLARGEYTLRVIEHPYDPTGLGLLPPQVEEFEVWVTVVVKAENSAWGTIKATYR